MIKLKHSSKYRSTAKMPGYLNSLGMGLKNKSIQYSSLFSRIGYASLEWFSIVLLCLFISMCPFSADIIRLLHFKSISKCSAQAKCSMDAKYNKIGQSWRSSIKIKTENLLNKIYICTKLQSQTYLVFAKDSHQVKQSLNNLMQWFSRYSVYRVLGFLPSA